MMSKNVGDAITWSRVAPALLLFLLAPLIAEFLLGNLPIQMLGTLIVMAPMYGGGALLIREAVRRRQRGWPSILLLALAYGVVEEAFVTQSLFNPDYLSLGLRLLQPGFIPALGIGAWWTLFVLTLHTAWSIATPIALVEALVPARATIPWLRRGGLILVSLLFAFGVACITLFGRKSPHPFMASDMQLASSVVVCLALVLIALNLPWRSTAGLSGWVPNPWLIMTVTLAAGSAVLLIPQGWGWWAALAIVMIDGSIAGAALLISRRVGWSGSHRLALAAGAAMSYAWHAFIQKPVFGGTGAVVRTGNAVFALGAVMLLVAAARKQATVTAVTK